MPPCGKDIDPVKTDVENLEGEMQYSRALSLEFLNPSHSSPLRKTSFNAATFNLVATIIGGGVLSLPLAFAKVGIVLATLMMIFAAYITEFCLYILCSCARRTGSNSYMAIVRSAFGPVAEILVTSILSIYLLGVLVAFQVLLKDIFAPLARAFIVHFVPSSIYSPGKNLDAIVLASIILIISPLLVKRDLHSLRHFCYVGFFSVCVIVVSIAIKAYERNFLGTIDHYPTYSGKYERWSRPNILYFTDDWEKVFFAFPFVVLAFLCAFNVVEVHGALENPTRTRVRSVLHTAIFTSLALFEVFGLVGYFYAYDECQGNIFLNFGECEISPKQIQTKCIEFMYPSFDDSIVTILQ
jgi:amino acid permease